MKVIHFTERPLSGAPFRLVQTLKASGMDIHLISNQNAHYPAFSQESGFVDMQADLLLNLLDPGRLEQLLKEADLVHYHNHTKKLQTIFKTYPWTWDLVKNKPSVIHFHSPRLSIHDEYFEDPKLTKLVVAQFHVRLYPECRPVPNIVHVDEALNLPVARDNDPPIVAFTPSGCVQTGWHDKGCAKTLPVLREGFNYRFLTGRPWQEAMTLRQSCDIGIDEIVTGSYHMTSLESLSQGLATIAGLDELTVDALEMVTGTREHPWIIASPETLKQELTHLVEDRDLLREKQRASRAYMEKYWRPEIHAATFRSIYEGVLNK